VGKWGRDAKVRELTRGSTQRNNQEVPHFENRRWEEEGGERKTWQGGARLSRIKVEKPEWARKK